MAKLGDFKLQGLKDSRIFYMRNPPNFVYITMLVVILVIAGTVTWSCTATKAEEVENSGIVVDAGVSSISNDVAGTIISIEAEEGDFVSLGDTLIQLDSSAVVAEKNSYQESLKYYNKRVVLVDKFIDSITNDKPNPFVDYGDEKEFYETRQSYDNELSQTTTTDQSDSIRQKYLTNLYSQKSTYEKDIRNADTYREILNTDNQRIGWIDRAVNAARNDGNNPFNADTEKEFYDLYADYKTLYDKYVDLSDEEGGKAYMASAYQTKETFVNSMYTQRASLEKEVTQAQSYVDNGDVSAERLRYAQTMIDSLERLSVSNPFDPKSTSDIEVEYYNMFVAYNNELVQLDLMDKTEAIKLKYTQSMNTDKNNSNAQILQLQTNITSCDTNIAKYTITAATSGNVHYDVKLHEGGTLQAGTAIGSINSGSDRQVELYVSAHDRVRLNVGQDCKFTVDGLLQTEFGCARGQVLSIADDATVSEKGAFFKVIVAFDNGVLKDKDGNQIEILNGMTVRMWIVYEKCTYMEYFLDRLGF